MNRNEQLARWIKGITNEDVHVDNVALNSAQRIWRGFNPALKAAIFMDIDAPSTQDAKAQLFRVLGSELSNFISMKLRKVHVLSGQRKNNG